MNGKEENKPVFAVVSLKRNLFLSVAREAGQKFGVKFFATPLEAVCEALKNLDVQLVWLDGNKLFKEEAGAVRVLREVRPETRIIIEIPVEGRKKEDIVPFIPYDDISYVESPSSEKELEAVLGTKSLSGGCDDYDEVIGDLVSGLLDSLNNNLARVSGYLQLLEMEISDTGNNKTAGLLDNLKSGVREMERTLKDLEMTGGNIEGDKRKVNARSLLDKILDKVKGPDLVPDMEIPGNLMIDTVPSLFEKALERMIEIGRLLKPLGGSVHLRSRKGGKAFLVEVFIPQAIDLEWDVSKTFLPYYLSRKTRIPSLGLKPSVLLGLSKVLAGNLRVERGRDGGFSLEFSIPFGNQEPL